MLFLEFFQTIHAIQKGQNFPQYCSHQLLRYKPWKITQENAWDNKESSDENMINGKTFFRQHMQRKMSQTGFPNFSQLFKTNKNQKI